MSPLRMRMIEDMKLAGLSPGTQATYIDAVRKLAAYYRRSPDQLSEEEVRAYILHLRERGAARGTFKANYYGIQYLYRYTVSRDWALFAKKRPDIYPAVAIVLRPDASDSDHKALIGGSAENIRAVLGTYTDGGHGMQVQSANAVLNAGCD